MLTGNLKKFSKKNMTREEKEFKSPEKLQITKLHLTEDTSVGKVTRTDNYHHRTVDI